MYSELLLFILKKYFKDVSREFDEFLSDVTSRNDFKVYMYVIRQQVRADSAVTVLVFFGGFTLDVVWPGDAQNLFYVLLTS